jgi:hypothetical protein
MTRDDVLNLYFEWLLDVVCGLRFADDISFRKLLTHLHNTEFRYSIAKDENRAREGENLRHRFAVTQMPNIPEYEILDILAGPCSVLEMMIALAIYAEEHVMDNPQIGDRTGQWFWNMVVNLGLGDQMDDRFDRRYVEATIQRFLDRKYSPNGQGGLFTIRNCRRDLRKVEIFYQLCWYLGTIT